MKSEILIVCVMCLVGCHSQPEPPAKYQPHRHVQYMEADRADVMFQRADEISKENRDRFDLFVKFYNRTHDPDFDEAKEYKASLSD